MRITLGGSKWLHATTAQWRLEQKDAKLDLDKQRMAANKPKEAARDTSSVLDRLHTKRQLDPDIIMSGMLHGCGMRYYSDWYLSGLSGISGMDYDKIGGGSGAKDGLPKSEVEAQRRDSFRAAQESLGDKYRPIVDHVVLLEEPIHKFETRYANRLASSAVAIEMLNTGLRRLGVHYKLLKR